MSKKRENLTQQLQKRAQYNLDQARQVFLQAQQLQKSGYLTEAENLYHQILKFDPQQPDCLHYLGLIYMQKGELDQAGHYIRQSIKFSGNPVFLCNYGLLLSNTDHSKAIIQYKKALQLKPDYAEAWFNLGVSFGNMNMLEEAENAYNKAVSYREDYIKALYNLSCIQDLQSRKEKAEVTRQRIIDITPVTAEEHNMLGMALEKIGGDTNLQRADNHFRQAISLNPDYRLTCLESYINLGMLFEKDGQIEDAIRCYTKVLELDPGNVEARVNLALSLISNEQHDEAEDIFRKILDTYPNNTKALCGLASINSYKGEFPVAMKLYELVLAIDKGNSEAYFGLAECRKYNREDYDFINRIKNNSRMEASANYALGKVYNDLGDYDEAFKYYKIANDLQNKRIEYDYRDNTEFTNKIINVFSNEFMDRFNSSGDQSDLPVFVLGTPRSGTTLTEQIIASHPKVFAAGELRYIPQLVRKLYRRKNKFMDYPGCMDNLEPEDIQSFASEYLDKIRHLCKDENIIRITEDFSCNELFFPNAKIIHCRRNPLDTCLALYFLYYVKEHKYSFDLENLGYWYRDYYKLMQHWSSVLGDRIYNVDYEDIVNNTETTARKLIDHCGLEWDDQCLQFHTTQRKVKTASRWQVRQPIYQSSLERWKRYDKHIGPLKEILAGYY